MTKLPPVPSLLLTLLTAALALAADAAEPHTTNDIIYATVGDHRLGFDLHLPAAKNPPLIVWVHGGAWRGGSKSDMPLKDLLTAGYAVASVDYRLSPVAPFPAQVHDIKAAIRFLRAKKSEYGYDTDRLVIAGNSAGAHLAALVGLTGGVKELEGEVGEHRDQSSAVRAIVSFYGMSNLTTILDQSTPHGLKVRVPALDLLLGGQPADRPDLAKLASPVFHVDGKDPPILLIHGDQDPQAPINQSIELWLKYEAAKRPVRFHAIAGAKHGGKEFFDAERIKLVETFLAESLAAVPGTPDAVAPVTPANTVSPVVASAADASPAAVAMGILRTECASCHNAEKKKGGLLLTSRELAIAGGESGPAIVPGKAGDSRLIASLAKDADPHMPPKKQLSDQQIAALQTWIDKGAQWDAKAFAAAGLSATRPVVFGKPPAGYQPVLALAISPDEKTLAAGSGNHVRLHDLSKPERPILRVLEGAQDAVQSLAWSADGKRLAAGDFGRVLVWTVESDSAAPPIVLQGLVGRVMAVLFLPDGSLLAADGMAGSSGRVHLFKLGAKDAAAIRPLQSIDAHLDGVMALARNAKGDLLATGGGDKVVRLWQLPGFKKVGDIEGHTGRITSLAFSPDGERLASGSSDRDLKVWDVKTRERKVSAGPHPQAISGIAWPRADEILVACEDGTARASKPDASAIGRAYAAAGDALLSIAGQADGKAVFAGGYDGRVYEWGQAGKVMPALPEAGK